MLEKDFWPQTYDGLFPCDSVFIENGASLVFGNTGTCFKSSNRNSIGSDFCPDDSILSDRCADNIFSFNCPLSHFPEGDSNLSLFENDPEEKASTNLLHYGWPEIGNFEDVDRMFGSFDSAYELGTVDSKEELGLHSPSDTSEKPDDVLKIDSKFPKSNDIINVSEHVNSSKLRNASFVTDSNMRSASRHYENSCWPPENNGPSSNNISRRKDQPMPKEQGIESNGGVQLDSLVNSNKNANSGTVDLQKKHPKHENHLEERGNIVCAENCGSLKCINYLRDDDKIHSHQFISPVGIQKQKHNFGHESFGYSQNYICESYSDYSTFPSEQSMMRTPLSGIKSDSKGPSSNQIESIEISDNPSCYLTDIALDVKRKKPCSKEEFLSSFSSNTESVSMVQGSSCNLISIQKQVHYSENKFEMFNDVEGTGTEIPVELGSSNVHGSSFMNSGLDETSAEATGFRQLQFAIEKLDLRMKLCIRDSLYRLARSAEQRHNVANLSCWSRDNIDASGATMAEGADNCTVLLDKETNTNPLDRSVAHLLFHRPSVSNTY